MNPSVYARPDRYEQHSPGLPGDVEYYRTLAVRSRGPVLDLACGTGRITIAVARAGIEAIGIDREEAMLRVAKQRGAGLDRVSWIQSDMRRFALRRRFPLIVAPYRGLQHLLSEEDLAECLRRVHENLERGGVFAFDIANPGSLRLRPGSGAPILAHPDRGLTLRYFFAEEMDVQLSNAGLVVESIWGGFDGRPCNDDCSEMVWLARRRAGD